MSPTRTLTPRPVWHSSITVTEIIREKNGDAYNPSAGVDYNLSIVGPATVTWEFYLGCDPEKAKKIEKDCIDIMKQYMKKGCDQKTLSKVQEQMCVQHAKSVQNNSFWMGQLQSSYIFGESRDFHVNEYDELVKSITPADIKAVANKYINLNNYVSVKLRPEDGAVSTAD